MMSRTTFPVVRKRSTICMLRLYRVNPDTLPVRGRAVGRVLVLVLVAALQLVCPPRAPVDLVRCMGVFGLWGLFPVRGP
jgi:hypothetical protein